MTQTLWTDRLQQAKKFFEKSLERGRAIYLRYEDEREDVPMDVVRANFFYSNTNIIKESLYNSLPTPDVSRMQKGATEDDVARVAALMAQRALHYGVKCTKWFDASVKTAILDRLVPGLGCVWVRLGEDGVLALDHVFWEDFVYEPARTWEEVTWAGRKHLMSKSEVESRYGKKAVDELEMQQNSAATTDTPKEIVVDKYVVYELWDKTTKKVVHISHGMTKPLLEADDPYNLIDFWPFPKPMFANVVTSKLLPVPDYHIAQDQYLQLDQLTARTGLIIKAVKVAGLYDASSQAIGRMLSGTENTLIPVDNWAMLSERGGVKGMIDWYPVDEVVKVLSALSQQIEATKATLYEITGMSDIIRGASNAYETAAAQQIKAQFAGVRLGAYQRDVAVFVRDILRIMTEIMFQLYQDEAIVHMVGPLPQPDQQLVPQALQLLRNDKDLKYRVDIQSDSLTQADWQLEKTQRLEFTNTIATFLQSAVPAVQQSPELGVLLLQMIKFTVAGFKGASEMEGWIDQQLDAMIQKSMQPQPPPPPPPEVQKMQAEMQMEQQKMQMDMQKQQAEMQMETQKQQGELALKQQEAQLEAQSQARKDQMELQHLHEKHQLEMQILQQKAALESELGRQKMRQQAMQGQMKLEQERESENVGKD